MMAGERHKGPDTADKVPGSPSDAGRGLDAGASGRGGPSASSSGSSPTVRFHGTPIPVAWLVQRHDTRRFPDTVVVPRHQQQEKQQFLRLAQNRDTLIAASAAAVHLAIFAWNLAFWGSEGMPPDRYWPANSRLKMGVRPGNYGNLDGTKRVYYDNLSALEGIR